MDKFGKILNYIIKGNIIQIENIEEKVTIKMVRKNASQKIANVYKIVAVLAQFHHQASSSGCS